MMVLVPPNSCAEELNLDSAELLFGAMLLLARALWILNI